MLSECEYINLNYTVILLISDEEAKAKLPYINLNSTVILLI